MNQNISLNKILSAKLKANESILAINSKFDFFNPKFKISIKAIYRIYLTLIHIFNVNIFLIKFSKRN